MKKIITMLFIIFTVLMLVSCIGGSIDFTVDDKFTDEGKLIINLFGHDMDYLQNPINENKKMIEILENEFNIKFKVTTTTFTSASTLLNQQIGGGDVPDMFIHFRNEPAYSSWLESEILMDYEKYLDDYPNLSHAFTALGSKKEVKSLLNGGLYSYPIIIHNDFETGQLFTELGMYYRRDWYQALVEKDYIPESGNKLKDPEDPTFNYLDFYDLLEGFTYGDPDGNGNNDTYGYSLHKDEGVHWWNPILNMFGVSPSGWHLEDDKWMPDAISDKMYEAVQFMAKLYDNKLINQNYNTTTTFEAAKNNFINGEAGVMVYNVTGTMGSGTLAMMHNYIGDIAGSKTMIDVVRGMPVVTGKDGVKRVLGSVNNYGYLAINNDISENKKHVILSLLDYILSDEGDRLLTWGIEGDHYEVNADGSFKNLLELDTRGYQKQLYDDTVAPAVYRLKGLASWDTPFTNNPRPYPEVVNQLMTAWTRENMFLDPLAFISADPDYSAIKAELDDKVSITYKQIVSRIAGDTPEAKKTIRDRMWDDFVRYFEVRGNSYINMMNDKAREFFKE